jgi:site-specific recombinase XerD
MFLGKEDVGRLLDGKPPRPDAGPDQVALESALFEVIYGAGLRVSEAVGLARSSIDLEGQLVRVLGKGGKERIVPLGHAAADWVRRYVDAGASTLSTCRRLPVTGSKYRVSSSPLKPMCSAAPVSSTRVVRLNGYATVAPACV